MLSRVSEEEYARVTWLYEVWAIRVRLLSDDVESRRQKQAAWSNYVAELLCLDPL